jgi:hypothetical protein
MIITDQGNILQVPALKKYAKSDFYRTAISRRNPATASGELDEAAAEPVNARGRGNSLNVPQVRQVVLETLRPRVDRPVALGEGRARVDVGRLRNRVQVRVDRRQPRRRPVPGNLIALVRLA